MPTLTVIKLDHTGREQLRYTGQELARGVGWVQLEARFAWPDVDQGYVVLRRGDRFVEWFFSDRWYNIFEIHDGTTDALKGWYCNITRPAAFHNDIVQAEDLALDLWVTPGGAITRLDESEYAALPLTAEERVATAAAEDAVRRAVVQRTPPFDRIAVAE